MTSPLSLLTNGLKQYVVSPVNAFGLGGFVFDVEGETVQTLTSEITDHFLEDNSSVQDHISLRPKRVTLRRYVGELVHEPDQSLTSQVQSVVQKLTTLSSFLPTLSDAAEQIFSLKQEDVTFNKLRDTLSSTTINKLTDYWAFSQNLLGQESRQQRAFSYLKALQEQRILVSLQTPFEFLNNMAIESIVATQPEGSKYISEFAITLKQIRFASLITAPTGSVGTVVSGTIGNPETTLNVPADQFNPAVLQGKAAVQNEPLQNNGVVNGTKADFESKFGKLDPGVLLPPPSL